MKSVYLNLNEPIIHNLTNTECKNCSLVKKNCDVLQHCVCYITTPLDTTDGVFFISADGDAGLDRADSFFAVSPVKQRNKAWSTPSNNPLPKGNLFDELADKENIVNQYKKRKTNRYEYYKKRLKKKTRTSGLKARANVINKPITPQRADPLDFI